MSPEGAAQLGSIRFPDSNARVAREQAIHDNRVGNPKRELANPVANLLTRYKESLAEAVIEQEREKEDGLSARSHALGLLADTIPNPQNQQFLRQSTSFVSEGLGKVIVNGSSEDPSNKSITIGIDSIHKNRPGRKLLHIETDGSITASFQDRNRNSRPKPVKVTRDERLSVLQAIKDEGLRVREPKSANNGVQVKPRSAGALAYK